MCGYYLTIGKLSNVSRGSPPRVRVLLKSLRGATKSAGITPACAGTTLDKVLFAVLDKDHPRVCGYYLKKYGLSLTLRGSPPRVRVLQDVLAIRGAGGRITPACAGTTLKDPLLVGLDP